MLSSLLFSRLRDADWWSWERYN